MFKESAGASVKIAIPSAEERDKNPFLCLPN